MFTMHSLFVLLLTFTKESEGLLCPTAFYPAANRRHESVSALRMLSAGNAAGNFYDEDSSSSSENQGEESRFAAWLQDGSRRRRCEHQQNNAMSPLRRERLERERDRESRFLSGDDLQDLRRQVLGLRNEMQCASISRKRELEQTILRAQQMDAEFIYHVALERAEAAEHAGLYMEAARYRQEAEHARAALPQFNLKGLWVGKYGDHGFELINVTYSGDTLIATKVTGDQNVPKGQMSFQVDLNPRRPTYRSQKVGEVGSIFDGDEILSVEQYSLRSVPSPQPLEPIELNQEAAEQWGSRYLQRFQGMGQVASGGFRNAQWMEGQLILVGTSYFSFAWLPVGHQVFFGRPSAEMTLKLLRESSASENKVDSVAPDRQFLDRCWEETQLLDDEMEVSDGLFVSHDQNDYYNMKGCFE